MVRPLGASYHTYVMNNLTVIKVCLDGSSTPLTMYTTLNQLYWFTTVALKVDSS